MVQSEAQKRAKAKYYVYREDMARRQKEYDIKIKKSI